MWLLPTPNCRKGISSKCNGSKLPMADQGLPQRQTGQRRRKRQPDAQIEAQASDVAAAAVSLKGSVPSEPDRLQPDDDPAHLDELRSQAAAGHNFECKGLLKPGEADAQPVQTL